MSFDIKQYIPDADHGSILITTRLATLWRVGTDLKLEPVDEQQGEGILKNNFGKPVEVGSTSKKGSIKASFNLFNSIGLAKLIKLL